MTAKTWFKRLLQDLKRAYMGAYPAEGSPEAKYSLQLALSQVVSFSDLLVASSLRRRALGETVNTKGGFTLEALQERNPWIFNHRITMSTLIRTRVEATVSAELEHIERMRKLRAQVPKHVALMRAEMMMRHATGEIAHVSEQVQLSIPEIGGAFPIGEYLTRDDRRVRPTHKAMYGFLAARTHEIWTVIRPLNGFNCRCFVRWVTKREAKNKGWDSLEIRWPNSASRRNYEAGVFPDEGWRGPKLMSH